MFLLACPACSRQYDATGFDPRRKIRCRCGILLEVGFRGPLAVTGLACERCGGTVGADDASCPYCQAALSVTDRSATTLCPICFVRLADDARHCSQCGTALAPQVLTPLPEGVACPRCAGELRIRMLEDVDGIECASCGGIWLDPRDFEAFCRDAEARAEEEPTPSAPGPRPLLEPHPKYIPCVRCGELMIRRQFSHRGRSAGVVIDFCRDHGVWLDANELERILDSIRTSRPGAVARTLEGDAGWSGMRVRERSVEGSGLPLSRRDPPSRWREFLAWLEQITLPS